MTAGISEEDIPRQKKLKELGLISNHSYGILNILEKGSIKLIKLRNPWGKFEWNGDWSDNSKKWTPELKKMAVLTEKDDGSFWMCLKDFQKYFSDFQVCKYDSDFVFSSEKIEKIKPGTFIYKINVTKSGPHTFGISQVDKRLSRYTDSEKYDYSGCRYAIFDKQYRIIKSGKCAYRRDSYIEFDNIN